MYLCTCILAQPSAFSHVFIQVKLMKIVNVNVCINFVVNIHVEKGIKYSFVHKHCINVGCGLDFFLSNNYKNSLITVNKQLKLAKLFQCHAPKRVGGCWDYS